MPGDNFGYIKSGTCSAYAGVLMNGVNVMNILELKLHQSVLWRHAVLHSCNLDMHKECMPSAYQSSSSDHAATDRFARCPSVPTWHPSSSASPASPFELGISSTNLLMAGWTPASAPQRRPSGHLLCIAQHAGAAFRHSIPLAGRFMGFAFSSPAASSCIFTMQFFI